MPSVAEALRQHGPASVEKFGARITVEQQKVLAAIQRCRTGEFGGVIYECSGCGRRHWVGRSCGNRHCPTCQHAKTAAWLAQQTARLLPVHYFLVTFTVPEALRSVLRAHPREGYAAIFDAGSGTIRTLATNFLFPESAASTIYRAKFRDALKGAG